ncbi:alpha/beta hydrolase [Portibacter marinus]|uniref:alpha/beta hydrolase n=1 Tax=Portibacter marinus TaxID=2898660 RepID=UPI001F29C64A|nr:alpha/beta hydrolase [Portibacter marinus]
MKDYFLLLMCAMFWSLSWTQDTEYIMESNLKYYQDSNLVSNSYQSERCVLDLYYPKGKESFATIVWFHGGGLTSGEKEIPVALLDKGVAVVGVNYRLYPRVRAPEYIEDAAAAVAFVVKNIKKYGGDPSLIFVSGHSAGGYLASMIGLDTSYLAKHGVDANNIAGLIPFSGHTITHFTVRKERGIRGTQPIIDELAPLYHVRKDAPPVLLITGDRELELLGRYEENAYFYRMMKIIGHQDIEILELDGYDHSMTEPAFPLLLKEIERITKRNQNSVIDK